MIKLKNTSVIILFFTLFFMQTAFSNDSLCHGSFINPITDVCWSCLFPITIGAIPVVQSTISDTDNPSIPLCACGTPFPRIGISTGFWEPMAMVDVTRHPFCMVNLGGFQLNIGAEYGTGRVETASSDDNSSMYYVHWYQFPLLYWLNSIIDGLCLDTGDLDIAYLTELDPTWNDDELGFIIDPEALLFGNLLAQSACAADSLAASLSKSIDDLFWCAGAQGSMYPLNGHIQEHVGGVQASTLLTERMAYKMHRERVIVDSVAQNSPALCYPDPSPIIPKSRYRYQMLNPVPTTGQGGCHPFGATTATWGAGHEIPFKGEDFGYLVFRKRNCCAL